MIKDACCETVDSLPKEEQVRLVSLRSADEGAVSVQKSVKKSLGPTMVSQTQITDGDTTKDSTKD